MKHVIDRKGIGDRIENYSTGKAYKQTSDWQRNTELSLNVVLPQYHNTMVPQCHSATVPQYHGTTVTCTELLSSQVVRRIEQDDGAN